MTNQKGMTFIGMLFTATIAILLGIGLMRIVPVYLEHSSIVSAAEGLQKIPASQFTADPLTDSVLLKKRLLTQLDLNGINLSENKIKIGMGANGKYKIDIQYQVTKPLFANISLLFDFKDSVEVSAGGA